MENQQDGIAVGSGMNEFERENLYEGYPKHTDMTEAIQQGANVDDTNEGSYPSVMYFIKVNVRFTNNNELN